MRVLICLLVSAAGFTINCMAYYPGFLSPDTIDQYTQALNNHYGDWHPPMMAALWHLLLYIYNGPQPIFIFQLLLLWSACYLLMYSFIRRYSYFTILIPLVLMAPFVQNFSGNIWKDVHLAFAWLLAFVILFNAGAQQRKMNRAEAIFSLLLLAYGCWVRPNGLPGFVPLGALWLAGVSRSGKDSFSLKPRFLVKTLVLTLLVLISQKLITKYIIHAQKNYIEYKLFAHDLTGIYYETNELLFPDHIKNHWGFDTVYIKEKFSYTTFDHIWWNNDKKVILPDVDDEKIKEIRNYWFKTVVTHPRAYLKNKAIGFLYFMRFKNSGAKLCTFYPRVDANPYGFSNTPNRVGQFFIEQITLREEKFYMQPWFWLFFNMFVALLALIRRVRAIRPYTLALALSSFFYMALDFFIFPADTEFRYFYWNCIALSIAFILILAEMVMPAPVRATSAAEATG